MATARTHRPLRTIDVFGVLSIGLALLLSSGVTAVRAEGPAEADEGAALMSVDPALVQAAQAAPVARPAAAPPTGMPAGMVQLNTRGFNYGPGPQALDREALRFEVPAAKAPAAPR